MKTTWVVVADQAIARILEKPSAGDLRPVEELTDPGAHAREAEFRHGPHGRRSGGAAGRSQATVGASDSERHQHAQAFAARIVQRLQQLHAQGQYKALHLIAAPRQLGYLRSALPPALSAIVVCALDLDLIHESNARLTQRLFPAPGTKRMA